MEEIKKAVQAAVKDLFNVVIEPELTRPDEQFGDYSTNVALQLAGKLNKNPKEIADELTHKLGGSEVIAKAKSAGPGFINIHLGDEALAKQAFEQKIDKLYKDKTIVIEHTDPNPFKPFHVGHTYSNTVGESIRRLLLAGGAKVHQVSYHGDTGKHIAMAVWAIGKRIDWQASKLEELNEHANSEEALIKSIKTFDGLYYAEGSSAYKEDPTAKQEIDKINQQIYNQDPLIMPFYNWGRDKSFGHFEVIYGLLGVKFEKSFYESKTGPEGKEIVEQHIRDGIFEQSEGAVVFNGDKFDLHTRVFITSQGLPTYEAKEVGLAYAKKQEYSEADLFIVVTANEIDQYFQVLVSALKQIDNNLGSKIKHISHGVVKLPYGKMSSRTGSVVTFAGLELDLERKLASKYGEQKLRRDITLGSIKYAFLKHRIGGDIVYDIDESISVEGNSGPYLQYAHARACSILAKATKPSSETPNDFKQDERSLVRKISEYPEVVNKAVAELMPHHICTYLYELAQNFNRFYENNRVIGVEREPIRLKLVETYASTLKNGLGLLNISAPEKM